MARHDRKNEDTRTRALNISEEGISLELPEAAMPSLVRFQSERFNVNGLASVRYCRRVGSKFVVAWNSPTGCTGELRRKLWRSRSHCATRVL